MTIDVLTDFFFIFLAKAALNALGYIDISIEDSERMSHKKYVYRKRQETRKSIK